MARPQNSKNDLQQGAQNALSKLFGVSAGEVAATGFKLLPPSQIETAPQPRTVFDEREIGELAQSIAGLREAGGGIEKTGILQPLLVGAMTDGSANYRLISGERRLRAAQSLNLPLVPVVVQSGASIQEENGTLWAAQIVENLQRRDLPPLDEAHALWRLIHDRNLSIREAAALLGKPKSYLSDRLALLKMGEDVQELVSERSDTLLHARLIDAIEEPVFRAELIQMTRSGAGRRELERLIQEKNAPEILNKPHQNELNPKSDSTASRPTKHTPTEETNRNNFGPSDRSDNWRDASFRGYRDLSAPYSAADALAQFEQFSRNLGECAAEISAGNVGRLNHAEKVRLRKILEQLEKRLATLREGTGI